VKRGEPSGTKRGKFERKNNELETNSKNKNITHIET
jgi:hypothetical protein